MHVTSGSSFFEPYIDDPWRIGDGSQGILHERMVAAGTQMREGVTGSSSVLAIASLDQGAGPSWAR